MLFDFAFVERLMCIRSPGDCACRAAAEPSAFARSSREAFSNFSPRVRLAGGQFNTQRLRRGVHNIGVLIHLQQSPAATVTSPGPWLVVA